MDEERLGRFEKRQKALFRALQASLTWRGQDEHGNRAEYELGRLQKAFDTEPESEYEEEPGEDQEWKTCDCCGGTGKVTLNKWDDGKFPSTNSPTEVDCDACDGKGKYIDDMD